MLQGYNASHTCNCTDDSKMLNCGKKTKSGEMHDANYVSTGHIKNLSCISQENNEYLENFDLNIIITSKLFSILTTNIKLYNSILNGFTSKKNIFFSSLNNILLIDIDESKKSPISTTFIKGELTVTLTYIIITIVLFAMLSFLLLSLYETALYK